MRVVRPALRACVRACVRAPWRKQSVTGLPSTSSSNYSTVDLLTA